MVVRIHVTDNTLFSLCFLVVGHCMSDKRLADRPDALS